MGFHLPYKSNNNIHIESSTSLSSQPSLPSIPSLTPSTSSSQQIQHVLSTSTTLFECIATLKGHSSYVFSLAFGGDNLYSSSSDREIYHWSQDPNVAQEGLLVGNGVVVGHGAVKCLVVLGDKLFSAHQDHKIRVWKINGGDTLNHRSKCIATLPVLNDRVHRLFSTKTYIEVQHVDAISSLAVSKDGSLLYSASWDRTFKIWRASDFHCLESVPNAHDDAINDIVTSTDSHVYTCSSDKKIKIWNKNIGHKHHTLVATLEKHKSAVNALALSNDSSVLYSGACDRSILVWEKNGDGKKMVVIGALRGHKMAILCLTIVTNDLICSGSADKTIRVWKRGSDLKQSYSCLAVLEGHNGPVKCLVAAVDKFNCSFFKNNNYKLQSRVFSTVDHTCKTCIMKSTTCGLHSSMKSSNSLQCITDDEDDSGHNFESGDFYLVYSGSLDCDIRIWRVWVPFI